MKKFLLILIIIGSAFLFTACNPLEKKMKSGLQVITDEVNASLFLDGKYLDKTPYINKSIQPGTYNLRIEPDDAAYIPYETTVNLRKSLLTVVTWNPGKTPSTSGGVIYELEPIESRKQADVSFITIPDNAIIQFDANDKQFSPLIINNLEAGHHEFEVSLPSYETQKHTINVVEGHRLNVLITLSKMSDEEEETATPTQESSPSATTEDNIDQATPSSQLILGARIKIKSTNFYMNSEEVLRVRDQAGSTGKELGFARVGKEFKYLNETANDWYKIDFEGKEGWVSAKYAQLIEN